MKSESQKKHKRILLKMVLKIEIKKKEERKNEYSIQDGGCGIKNSIEKMRGKKKL